MSNPSFAQLFRRSRYSRFSQAGDNEEEQNRREVFAVAAVGFALKHDTKFKKNFLERFAGIADDWDNFQPNIQASNCEDLNLENSQKRILVVLECKVWAPLKDHQNPWRDGRKPDNEKLPFWSEANNGYGHQLRQKNFDQIYYIVVRPDEKQRDEEPFGKSGKTFWLKTRGWKALLYSAPGLEEDLVKSLGELGIEELEDWRMKDITVKSGDLEAFFKGQEAMELVLRISAKLGMRRSRAYKDLVLYSTESSHDVYRQLGIGLPDETLKLLGGIRAICLKGAWFGYLSEKNQQFKAQVWFYGNKGVQPKLRALVNEELKASVHIEANPEDIENGLRIFRSEDTSLGDLEWFCKILGIQ